MIKRCVTIAVSAAVVSLLGVLPAQADPAEASAYAQHVRMCQQMMGFDGVMNPGMHRGRSGWDPTHTCMMD